MTVMEIGVTGAKRQSFEQPSPRDVLKRMIDENPGLGEHAAFVLFCERVAEHKDGEALTRIIMKYWFTNNYRSLMEPTTSHRLNRARVLAERQAGAASIVAKVKEHIDDQVRVILGDMTMPNGKALRDCTGSECRTMGGWLSSVAANIGPTRRVGDALSEEQLRELYLRKPPS